MTTRKATTFRIDPAVQAGLSTLGRVLGKPMNQLVNEAIKDFVARRSREVEIDLEATLEELRAWRRDDPDFDHAIDAVIEAEASGAHDPAQGRVIEPVGPAQAKVLELLNG